MKSNKFEFQNQEGISLSGRIDFPLDKQPTAFAIFAHCFTCNKNLLAVKNISRALTDKGFAVMLFDFTGLGASDGNFTDTNFSSNIADLMSAAEYLKSEYIAPKILIGHSLGGAAALFAAKAIESIEAVVTIGAPFDPKHVTHLLEDKIDEIEAKGKAKVNIGGRPFVVSMQFIKDLENRKAADVAKALRKPLLIMHSPQDATVGIKNAANIYTSAHHPKSFISLDGADHLLSQKADSKYAGYMIAAWVEKYIEIEKTEVLKGKSKVIARTNYGSFTTELKAGNHHLTADEPDSVGGLDLGPTPYDLLSSALAACTSMTIQMYAKRKEWPIDSVIVHVNHEKDYAEDCENCEGAGSKIDRFKRSIEFIGELEEQQIKRLLEIADKCPVHKSLHSEVRIITQLKKD